MPHNLDVILLEWEEGRQDKKEEGGVKSAWLDVRNIGGTPGVPHPQAKGPQGLEGLISSPTRQWRTFFFFFHHFDNLKYDYLDIKMGLFLVYTACCD